MGRLDSFELKIKTGASGLEGPLRYSINNFPLDFESVEGGTGPGETAAAVGRPESFPHTLLLLGPESGEWEIAGIEAVYQCAGEEPYTVRLGAVTLDDASDLNVWHPRPAAVVDV